MFFLYINTTDIQKHIACTFEGAKITKYSYFGENT